MLEIRRYKDGIAFLKNSYEFAFYSSITDKLRFSDEYINMSGYDWITITVIYEVISNYKKGYYKE